MDQTVSTADIQISHKPQTRVLMMPNSSPSNSRKGIATICDTVLSLPIMCTATLLEAPICAIHSRNAEMAISRPMMISATNTSPQMHQNQHTGAHQKLVCDRVEKSAKRRGLVQLAGQVAVKPVGGGKHHEHDSGDEVPGRFADREVKNANDEGNRNNARPGHQGRYGPKHALILACTVSRMHLPCARHPK